MQNILLIIVLVLVVILCTCSPHFSETYNPDPQIVYADYRMTPEFPTADHFKRNNWVRYNLSSDDDPFTPYYPYYGISPYFEGGQ